MSLKSASEFKIVTLRETPSQIADTPQQIAQYFRDNVTKSPWYDEMKECLVGITLNTRKRITGFYLIALGTLDSIQIHPREVFRPALIKAAHALIICHNHPSGDPTPSQEDAKVTRDLFRSAGILKIEFLDHLIIGRLDVRLGWQRQKGYASMRELGYIG